MAFKVAKIRRLGRILHIFLNTTEQSLIFDLGLESKLSHKSQDTFKELLVFGANISFEMCKFRFQYFLQTFFWKLRQVLRYPSDKWSHIELSQYLSTVLVNKSANYMCLLLFSKHSYAIFYVLQKFKSPCLSFYS